MSLLWVTAAAHPYTQQDWYHGGLLDGGRNLYDGQSQQGGINWLHVGTKQAALDRINPKSWDNTPGEFPQVPHSRLYRVRLSPGTSVCPRTHEEGALDDDDPGSYQFTGAHCPGEFDAHPYVNQHEDRGNVSLAVKSSKVRVMEDLGRHPAWQNDDVRNAWRTDQPTHHCGFCDADLNLLPGTDCPSCGSSADLRRV